MSDLFTLVTLPLFNDDCQLVVGQAPEIPFEIKRVYYILQPVAHLPRGHHAHYKTEQVLVCLQGKVRMRLDNGTDQVDYWLTKPNEGMVIRPMIWHEMLDMTEDTILLVLASAVFDEADYIRDYTTFKQLTSEVP